MSEAPAKPFSASELQALACALDEIIPARDDRRLPGAGEVGVAAFVEEALDRTPFLKDMVFESLAALEALARERHACTFLEVSAAGRGALLGELANGDHGFPPVVTLQALAGYYQNPRIVEALGLEARPPHPLGYDMGRDDMSLLDPVKRRKKMYRRP